MHGLFHVVTEIASLLSYFWRTEKVDVSIPINEATFCLAHSH
jgi:hypothetical protein